MEGRQLEKPQLLLPWAGKKGRYLIPGFQYIGMMDRIGGGFIGQMEEWRCGEAVLDVEAWPQRSFRESRAWGTLAHWCQSTDFQGGLC